MPELFIKLFTHLQGRPKADQALPLLQRIASLVKPIMRKHGWVLPVLAEFFPESPNLVGLNVNGGQKILLRLRPASAPDTFYDEDDLVHTMLHELTHNVHGPHDEKFYKLLSELAEEYDALKRSGYAGEGFFSKGHRLGENVSHNLPAHLARAKALEAAEKRKKLFVTMSGGGRVGGTNRGNKSPRELAAEAAERRARDEKACATGTIALREAAKAAQDSVEDEVIDLTADDDDPEVILRDRPPVESPIIAVPRPKTAPRRVQSAASSPGRRPSSLPRSPVTRRNGSIKPTTPPPSPLTLSTPSNHSDTPLPRTRSSWPCPRCTLLNEALTLQCAACLTIRPEQRKPSEGWNCASCGERGMPHQLWSCRFCGSVKTESVLG